MISSYLIYDFRMPNKAENGIFTTKIICTNINFVITYLHLYVPNNWCITFWDGVLVFK